MEMAARAAIQAVVFMADLSFAASRPPWRRRRCSQDVSARTHRHAASPRVCHARMQGMFDWDDARYFLAIHRTGTLSAAARRLGVNQSTVGRRLEVLEEQL